MGRARFVGRSALFDARKKRGEKDRDVPKKLTTRQSGKIAPTPAANLKDGG
jgi:hypothetical protein